MKQITAIYTSVDGMSEKIFNNLSTAPGSIVFESYNQFDTAFQILKRQEILFFHNQKTFTLQEFPIPDMIDKSVMTILDIVNIISDSVNRIQALQTSPAYAYIFQFWVASTDTTDATLFEQNMFINLHSKQVLQTSVTQDLLVRFNLNQIKLQQVDPEQVIQGLQYMYIPLQQLSNIKYYPQIYQALFEATSFIDVLDAGSIDNILQEKQFVLLYNQDDLKLISNSSINDTLYWLSYKKKSDMIDIPLSNVNLQLLSQNQKDLLAQNIKMLLLLAPNQAIQSTSFAPTYLGSLASGEVETDFSINNDVIAIRQLEVMIQQIDGIDQVDGIILNTFLEQNMDAIYEDEPSGILAIVVDGIIFG
jgi:hypothetical protein